MTWCWPLWRILVVIVLLGLTTRLLAADAERNVLVIRLQFADRGLDHHTAEVDREIVAGQVAKFYRENSFGQVELHAHVLEPVYVLGPVTDYEQNPGRLWEDAWAAVLRDAGAVEHDIPLLVFPSIPAYTRRAFVAQGRVFINGALTFHLAAHELGHVFGLQHASSWEAFDGQVFGEGVRREYGDPFDIMGSGVTVQGHFNPQFKRQLGWIQAENVPLVRQSGTFRVYRFDHPEVDLSQPLALRVSGRGRDVFWVCYRRGMTGFPSLEQGAYVLWEGGPARGSLLLDMAPETATHYDAGLPIGRQFTDPGSGVTLRPVRQGGVIPNEWIEVEVEIRDFGLLAAWGSNHRHQLFFPDGLDRVVSLAAGLDFSLALLEDGQVVGWGDPGFNPEHGSRVPTDLGDVVRLWASDLMAVALRVDGTLRHWGWGRDEVRQAAEQLSQVREVGLGEFHLLAFLEDGLGFPPSMPS